MLIDFEPFIDLSVELLAGMPMPLPDDLKVWISLTDNTRQRLQSISFFAFAFLMMTWAVQGMWNYLVADFPWLPKLRFTRALVLVVLLGTVFLLVLTMISGARELLTPGAWKKNGWTYTLPPEKDAQSKATEARIDVRSEPLDRTQSD